MIGAGATAAVGLLANALRAYIVTVPCQTPEQDYCTGPWAFGSVFAWIANPTSSVLFGIGGAERGRYDASLDPARHRGRRAALVTIGSLMLSVGLAGNILIRSAWLNDYLHPEGPEVFDFARPGDSIGYYGGLQGTSLLIGGGAALLGYGSARSRKPPPVSVAPMGYGLQLSGRF